MGFSETAYAKINLALHVRHRRADGYHEIETLFAFVDDGDRLSASPAARDVVHVKGEFAAAVGDGAENIVAKALAAFLHVPGWFVSLDKRLPVAAGLGGGSADAGAIVRMIERWSGLPADWRERAGRLGADVPACVVSRMCLGRGTGSDLCEVDNDLAGTPVLLVNPRLPLPTGPVFAAWDGVDRGPLTPRPASVVARVSRNDLEAPAIALCPPIAEVLAVLGDTEAWLVRMSGSGATCFALFADPAAADAAERAVAAAQPGWWRLRGCLRP